MAIKSYKPTSPGRRFSTTPAFEEITKSEPEKSLTVPVKRKGGRNNYGRITTRHQGGGHKRLYRIIDFKRDKDGVPGRVSSIEYDPNRNCRIALVVYADGDKRYILAPNKLASGRAGGGRSQRRHPRGLRPPAAEHPGGHRGAQHRDAQGPRWADRPLGRHLGPGHGQGRRLRHPAAALGRDAHDPSGVQGHHRRDRQCRAREPGDRQGRSQALDGRPAGRARYHHEPGRPPARWWRGFHPSGP